MDLEISSLQTTSAWIPLEKPLCISRGLACCNSWGRKETDTTEQLNRTELRGMCRRRQWNPTPVLLPGKSHGWRSPVCCSPWGREESDTTERLHFHFSLSCIGEGTGNPLQCSCLENPKDEGAWWAAIRGVARSRTRLKQLSSSSSSSSGLVGDTDIQYYVASVIQEGGTECCRNTGRNSPLELR